MPSNITLPPKENAHFKRILKCYEQKQYKNGLKFAKQILSNPKFAEHGETQAMKGLMLNCLGRKDEAYDHVRKGLTNDLKSHVCWHVYGLLQRSDKKYSEAIKCYRNALKWDKGNIQILRDLSLLQIQIRDLEGYQETRHQLLLLRPTQRASWIGFAMSYHLLNDFEMALKILEEFRKNQKTTGYDYEYSELLLYQNMIMKESGDVSGALTHLEQYEQSICDKIAYKETKGMFLLTLERWKEAEDIFWELINRNPENHQYYRRLEAATKAKTESERLKVYDQVAEKFPRANAPQRLPLTFLTGDEFKARLHKYVTTALRKGVPPLFVDLRPLYNDPDKKLVIETMLTQFMENLLKHSSFGEEGSPREAPSTLLWTYYFMAQHHDKMGDYQQALQVVDRAIEHTPTLIELYTLKAKIYKHAGDPEEAVHWLDEAQSMDTADRYINCKCAKYMLRANKITQAEEMCSKFTREGVPAMENLNEMQCMWFQSECALAYQRTGQYGEALKKCHEIDRHFSEIIEEQFDFHTYCTRKMTLKAYVGLLRLEDQLRSHQFYEKAAKVAIETLLHLHEKPLEDRNNSNDTNTDNLDPSEVKKRKNKAKKALKKAEEEKAVQELDKKRKELHNKNKKKCEDDIETVAKDELIPDKLARPEDPLAEASKFLEPLLQLSQNKLNTHLLAFEIYLKKGKVLLMLQSILRGLKAHPDAYSLHSCLVRFLHFVSKSKLSPSGTISKVVEQSLPPSLKNKSATQLNKEFLDTNKNDLAALLVGAKLMVKLDASSGPQAVKLATNLADSIKNRSMETCRGVMEALESGELGAEGQSSAASYRQSCSQIFPLAKCFRDAATAAASESASSNHVNNLVSQVESLTVNS